MRLQLILYEAAMSSGNRGMWERAMLNELEALRTSNTFTTAEKLADGKDFGAQRVFKCRTDQSE